MVWESCVVNPWRSRIPSGEIAAVKSHTRLIWAKIPVPRPNIVPPATIKVCGTAQIPAQKLVTSPCITIRIAGIKVPTITMGMIASITQLDIERNRDSINIVVGIL